MFMRIIVYMGVIQLVIDAITFMGDVIFLETINFYGGQGHCGH